MLENSAARKIEGKMKKMKVQIIHPRHSAIVEGREGPLDENAEQTFKEIGKEIAILIGQAPFFRAVSMALPISMQKALFFRGGS